MMQINRRGMLSLFLAAGAAAVAPEFSSLKEAPAPLSTRRTLLGEIQYTDAACESEAEMVAYELAIQQHGTNFEMEHVKLGSRSRSDPLGQIGCFAWFSVEESGDFDRHGDSLMCIRLKGAFSDRYEDVFLQKHPGDHGWTRISLQEWQTAKAELDKVPS